MIYQFVVGATFENAFGTGPGFRLFDRSSMAVLDSSGVSFMTRNGYGVLLGGTCMVWGVGTVFV